MLQLSLGFCRQVIELMGWDGGRDFPLVETIVYIGQQSIHKCRTRDLQLALQTQAVSYDFGSDDLDRIVELECVMDMFPASEQPLIATEVTNAKTMKEEQLTYVREFRAYQALRSHSPTLTSEKQTLWRDGSFCCGDQLSSANGRLLFFVA